MVRGDPIYREVLVADRYGRLVAASGVTSDYFQGDEQWWVEASSQGRVTVSDVAWDESAKVFAVEVATPIEAPSGAIVGVLKAVMDTRELFASVTGVYGGGTGTLALVRTDGSVVFSQRSVDPSSQYFAANMLRERLQNVQTGDAEFKAFFRAAGADGEPQLVALAASQIGRTFPELPWLIAVSEPESTLFAPVRTQALYLLVALAVVGVLMSVVALGWSARLAAPPDPNQSDLELQLEKHPRVHRIDDEERHIV